ncbi:MAG: Methylmalonyl-CoA carboxyltransferase 12S subunit [Myxococcota bacterium]|nr:Methylmalonyl-CoA carboxyltransferase 12S subunit [Myxococcota bacterium]
MGMREMVEELRQQKEKIRAMGGEARVVRQKDRNKLTVRERLDILFDPGSFLEIGAHATPYYEGPFSQDPPAPADGCVCGYGKINGRPAACIAYDFTVMGGSIGPVGEVKATRIRELALKWRMPVVWLIDSAGARVSGASADPSQISRFADSGYLFREQVVMSGVVPQVAAMVGPGAAGTAYIPGLADYVPMAKGVSSMALGGPPLVRAVVGEKITEEELGGSGVHNRESGVADGEFETDRDVIAAIKEYLSYFPSHCEEHPPVRDAEPPAGDSERLLDIIPENARRAYDVRQVIKHIVDGGRFFEIKPLWARNIVTCLARVEGRSVGVVASNPMHLGGVLDVDSSDKAARFINICDAFRIPLLFLVDVPGFLIGSKVEKAGIIRHGAKMLYAVSSATVPKVTIVLRKAYGAGYYVMCGRAYEPDYIAAWPGAEIAVMGPEGMVSIFANKMLEALPDDERRQAMAGMAENLRPHISPYKAAGYGAIDDIIDPRDTRQVIARALEYAARKRVDRPFRRREVSPV